MRVSVGLPFYNDESTLADAIRSVFAQTYEDWELILVDDGSVDGSLRIAEAVTDRRVRVVSDGANRGLPWRLNQIATLARGEYVARMDADDLMHPERLARQVRHLDAHPDISILGTGLYTIDRRNRVSGKRDGSVGAGGRDAPKYRRLAHYTILGRTEWFRANPYDTAFRRCQDLELWCRSLIAGTLNADGLVEPLHFYREDGSITLAKLLASYRTQREILRLHGPALHGRSRTYLKMTASHLKGSAYRVLFRLGKEMILVNRRSAALRRGEQDVATAVLESVLATPVPGLPPQSGPTARPPHCCRSRCAVAREGQVL